MEEKATGADNVSNSPNNLFAKSPSNSLETSNRSAVETTKNKVIQFLYLLIHAEEGL